MSASDKTISLMAALALPLAPKGAEVPDWIHLLPKGDAIETRDGRGPYHYKDAATLIADSMAVEGRLTIDVNHSVDRAGDSPVDARAHGYIIEMEERENGIWGRIDWTGSGHELMADRAYWGVSPVIGHDKAGTVSVILRAALTNKPNMRGLTALNQENDDMSFLAKLAAQLGLNAEASEEDVTDAITTALQGANSDDATALQSQLSEIGVALGVEADGDAAAILVAAQAKPADGGGVAITALQAEVATLTTSLNTERETRMRTAAETYVDGEIAKGRAGLKPVRDTYISMHMKDAAEAEKLIGAMPVLVGTTLSDLPPASKDGKVSLNADQSGIATMLGLSTDDYTKTLTEEAL